MPDLNRLGQLEAELLSIFKMLQTVPQPVLLASMRINTILAAAAYDEQAAKEAKALATATAEDLGIDNETNEQQIKRIAEANRVAEMTAADHKATAAQKKAVLKMAATLGLTEDQLKAFDIVTRMVHLDNNIKMAYASAAKQDQDKVAADDLQPFWLWLGQRCLSKSGMDVSQLGKLRLLVQRFITYSDKGSQGQHVLSRLENVLMSTDQVQGVQLSTGRKAQKRHHRFDKKPEGIGLALKALRVDENEQKQVPLPTGLDLLAVSDQIKRLEQRLLMREGQVLIDEFLRGIDQRRPFDNLTINSLVNFWQRAKEVAEGDENLPPLKEDDLKRVIFALNQLAGKLTLPARDSLYELSKAMQMKLLNRHLSDLFKAADQFTDFNARQKSMQLVNNLQAMTRQWLTDENQSPALDRFKEFKREFNAALLAAERNAAPPVWRRCLRRASETLSWLRSVVVGVPTVAAGLQSDYAVFKKHARQLKETVTDTRLDLPSAKHSKHIKHG